jgi:hypothetical protein
MGASAERVVIYCCHRLKIVNRKALVRIGAGLVTLVLIGWIAGRFMCHCGGMSSKILSRAAVSAQNLHSHIECLADKLGEHNVFNFEKLQAAADYIEQQWRTQGYAVVRHSYRAAGLDCANLEATRRGTRLPSEIVLVGAHYDSVDGSPGANDNGSGVAAMLELSRFFADRDSPRTIRFVAFVNEEPPFFETEQMGSRVYAKEARARGDDIRAMLSLETMGFYSNAPGSQHYPSFFRLFYPDRGNFIGFISDFSSRPLLNRVAAAFRAHSDFPAECVSTSRRIVGISWSDHASFWREGYRALMVTDTAPFRYPYYHTAQDTAEKVDCEALARVTEGLCGVVAVLAEPD